jgi:hypothetical protein
LYHTIDKSNDLYDDLESKIRQNELTINDMSEENRYFKQELDEMQIIKASFDEILSKNN